MMQSYQTVDEEGGDSTFQNSAAVVVETPKKPTFLWKYVGFGVIATVVCGFLVVSKSSTFGAFTSKSKLSSSDYSITVGAYIDGYTPIAAVSMLPWDAVLEPYKTNYLEVLSFQIDGVNVDTADYDVAWTIGDDVTLTGSSASVEVDDLGVYSSTVTLTSTSDSSVSYSYDFLLAVKYVRREIRTMSDVDRNKFMDALYTTYTVSGDEGRSTYGAKYKSASEALYRHLNGAGRTDCDHWHDGAGLITHHMAYTLEVEQSLQTIDPSIAMPYWEYGMDPYLYENWWDSPIFDADWFGEANPSTSDHSIDDGGRWSGLKMPSAAK